MTPPAADDPSLVAHALQLHEASLQRYATRLLHDASLARDVVQETFLALGAASAGQVRDHLAAWLFTVCRRKALNVLRKEGRMTPLEGHTDARLPAPDADPAMRLQHADDQRLLLDLVSRLPLRQREVVRLRYQEGFSYQEISRITEHSVSHVGVLLHTAIQAMRRDWETLTRPGGSPQKP